MTFTVKEKAEYLGTFRWIEVFLMETLAAWVPTTPEMEIKVLFGRHVWELAQNADALGKRTFELRAPLHYTVPPLAGFRQALEESRELAATGDRIEAFYDAVLPALASRYQEYLERTDELQDEPSVRVIERILDGHLRMAREREAYCGELAAPPASDGVSLGRWQERFSSRIQWVDHGAGQTLARPVAV